MAAFCGFWFLVPLAFMAAMAVACFFMMRRHSCGRP